MKFGDGLSLRMELEQFRDIAQMQSKDIDKIITRRDSKLSKSAVQQETKLNELNSEAEESSLLNRRNSSDSKKPSSIQKARKRDLKSDLLTREKEKVLAHLLFKDEQDRKPA